MKRIFGLALLLAFVVPSQAQISSIQFHGLMFPVSASWSNLTILPFGFGVQTSPSDRPTGPGTLSASVLEHSEYMVELEDGTQISLVTLLEQHLLGTDSEELSASSIKSGISDSFASASRIEHDSLSIYVEDTPFLPDQLKAYIIRDNKSPIEVSATMTHEEFTDYLMEVQSAVQ